MNQRTCRFVAFALLMLVSGIALAVIVPPPSPLADKEVRLAGLESEPWMRTVAELDSAVASRLAADLARLGVESRHAFIDARGGQWATLWLKEPILPGDGVGNDLTWAALGESAAPAASELGLVAWNGLVRYLDEHQAELRIQADQLAPRAGVDADGQLIQIRALRQVNGVPVRGASLGATISHGNLILLGVEQWGKVEVSTVPTLSATDATDLLLSYLAPFSPSGYNSKPRLELLPVGVDGAPGHGYSHRLVWIVEPQFAGRNESYEAAIDAHSGEVLFLQDTNSYATRNIKGGVLPASNDGQIPDGVEVPGYPMPFAHVTISPSGSADADAGGNLFNISGSITTDLSGPYIKMVDNCGAISQVGATGDLDLGVSGGTDCVVPAGASAGDTHASRTGYYELNRLKEQARGQWSSASPANTWLNAQLTSNMNLNDTCNAFWSNSNFTVNFYRSGGGCANTGELAGVFDHEWGHGMDFNGTAGGVSSPGEGIADVYAALRLDTSCVGRGFRPTLCTGYGDACTPASGCTGIRDIDWAHRTSGIPHTLTWALANANCTSVHCRGALYAEAIWDLAKRDLPTLHGMDNNTAMEVATRIAYKGADNVTTWFSTSVGTAGCAASSGYQQLLGADDDNGNLLDGTPHMQAISTAFTRHEIGCTTPTVTVSGCAGAPTAAVSATISPNDTSADLSWAAVPNATRYKIYRTDGEFGCNFGKALVATTTSLSFHDTGLQNGRLYSYIVTPFGASDACMGAASSCLNVTPAAGLSTESSAVSICTGNPAVYSITVTPPFVAPVNLSVAGNPSPSTTNLSPNPVSGPLPAVSTLTIGNTAGVAAGDHLITVTGNDGVTSFSLDFQLTAYTASPGVPSLTSPADGATSVPLSTSFTWAAQAGVAQYQLEVATDAAFTNIVRTATTSSTSTTVSPELPSNVELFWRVRGANTCGTGGDSAVRSLTTVSLPGDCALGSTASEVYGYGFEAGANGWTSSGTGDTWATSNLNTHSGTASWRASSPAVVSDQRLLSPAIVLPATGAGLTLQYWNFQHMESSSATACYDGAILEVTTNAGATFTQIGGADLLTDPYDGLVSASFSNPLAGLSAWCGDPQALTRSVVDISDFAGQTVQFRFRFGSDTSVNRSNGAWFLDDVRVQNCEVGSSEIFSDGFESGTTSAWSAAFP